MFNIYNIQKPPANWDKLPKDLSRDIIKKQEQTIHWREKSDRLQPHEDPKTQWFRDANLSNIKVLFYNPDRWKLKAQQYLPLVGTQGKDFSHLLQVKICIVIAF